MQIILHIGLHKTGSTAIQNAMKRYDDGETIYARLGHQNHSDVFYAAFSKRFQSYHTFNRDGLSAQERVGFHEASRKRITDFLTETTRRRVIFSGEGMTELDASSVKVMIETLGRYSDDLRVVAWARPPLEFAKSNVQQVLRLGSAKIERAMQPNYKGKLGKFIEAVGRDRVDLHLYDRSQFSAGDIITTFAETLGLDRKRMSRLWFSSNESISFSAQQGLYLLNQSQTLCSGDKELNAARIRFTKLLDRCLPHEEAPPDAAFLAKINRKDVEWIEQTAGFAFDLAPLPEAVGQGLEAVYSNMSEASIDVLIDILRFHGIRSSFDRDPKRLVVRVFYLCLAQRLLVRFRKLSPFYVLPRRVFFGQTSA